MSDGPTGDFQDISGTPFFEVLTFAELLNEQTIVQTKEELDKGLLEGIGNQSIYSLKPKLVEWVMKGCPNAFPVLSIQVQAPSRCSDGEVRTLPEYIKFCSGKTINEHVSLLQAKLPDITVSYANISGNIVIVVSKV